jgi:hypothetical protein
MTTRLIVGVSESGYYHFIECYRALRHTVYSDMRGLRTLRTDTDTYVLQSRFFATEANHWYERLAGSCTGSNGTIYIYKVPHVAPLTSSHDDTSPGNEALRWSNMTVADMAIVERLLGESPSKAPTTGTESL